MPVGLVFIQTLISGGIMLLTLKYHLVYSICPYTPLHCGKHNIIFEVSHE